MFSSCSHSTFLLALISQSAITSHSVAGYSLVRCWWRRQGRRLASLAGVWYYLTVGLEDRSENGAKSDIPNDMLSYMALAGRFLGTFGSVRRPIEARFTV